MEIILRLLVNPVIRYAVMTVLVSGVGLGALTWLRHSARAPYAAQVVELKDVIKKRDAAAEADRRQAAAAEARAEDLRHELDDITKSAGTAACKLSAAELARLHKLSRPH